MCFSSNGKIEVGKSMFDKLVKDSYRSLIRVLGALQLLWIRESTGLFAKSQPYLQNAPSFFSKWWCNGVHTVRYAGRCF